MAVKHRLTDERWRAVVEHDEAYSGRFFIGVRTTGIFCRPGCRARTPKRENVLVFLTAEEALHAGFRPCKRCRPLGTHVPAEEWVGQIKAYLAANYPQRLTLEEIAKSCHGSPCHLQRVFREREGVTPAQYLKTLRLQAAATLLRETAQPIAAVARQVGMPNPSHFVRLFSEAHGASPLQYRKQHGSAKPPKADQP